MALRKVIVEEYSHEKKFVSQSHEEYLSRPDIKLIEMLKPYSVLSDLGSTNFLEIPSVPGTKIYISHTTGIPSSIGGDIAAKLYYLEDANQEDLNEIRNMIEENGLTKKLK